jgi:hypothetical protein
VRTVLIQGSSRGRTVVGLTANAKGARKFSFPACYFMSLLCVLYTILQ